MKINFMVPASDGVWSLRSKTISRERKVLHTQAYEGFICKAVIKLAQLNAKNPEICVVLRFPKF